MGAATQLLLPGNGGLFIVIFGVGSLAGVLLVPYSTYAKYLKWLTISLFAYVGVAFFVDISWRDVLRGSLLPHIELSKNYRGGARHNYQPLFVFLAGLAGGRRSARQSR
jgi:hypothetical protein